MSASHVDVQSQAEDAAHAHPGDNVYFTMLGMLAVLTVIELIVFYITDSIVLRAGILVVLLLVKFVAQIGWFTHLRYDDRRITMVFGGALFIALSVMIAAVAMMSYDGVFIGEQFQ